MTLAISNRASLRYIEEVTFGQTPATPAFNELRYNGESLNYNINNIISDEIRADRMTTDLIQVQADASGDVNFELSYGAFDDFLAGGLADTWGTLVAVSATDIDAAAGDNSFNTAMGDFVADGIIQGQWVEVRGFTDPANNGYFRVTSVTSGKIIVAGGTLVTEAAGATITIGGSVVRNGVTPISYSVQKVLEDLSPAQYILLRGMRVGQIQLAFETASILTGTFSLMGLTSKVDTTGETGQTLVQAPTNEVMNATGNVQSVWIDDSLTTNTFFNTLNLNVNGNLRPQDAIGSLPHIGIALSRMEVTADAELYFQDDTEYQKFLQATFFSLAFRVEDNAGNAYIFTLPRCKYETGEVVAGGLDQDIFLSSTIRGLRDPVTDCMVQIDRFAA
ncbi:MAG: phage tail tube protein [Acidimicrobiia bacterium]|nr:phage tail tube protein [Acidimicrobiia bacterium]